MPTPTWERLPAARRDAVVAAAEAEFGAHGFSRGSLNVIAREAGVSKGSLFQYFADKEDLCAYLADVVSLRIRAQLEPHLPKLPWPTDFFGALRGLGRGRVVDGQRAVDRLIDAFRTGFAAASTIGR